jgi:3-phenylpropionate/trans-cinnamate dioxygenase ferredoxin subunit
MQIELSKLEDSKPIRIELDGEPVCVARVGDEVFAIGDTCTHSDASLSEGDVVDGAIECWLHGAHFDLRTGAALTPPAVAPVKTFKVKREDGFVTISKGDSNE